jgi:hypothetical protein
MNIKANGICKQQGTQLQNSVVLNIWSSYTFLIVFNIRFG